MLGSQVGLVSFAVAGIYGRLRALPVATALFPHATWNADAQERAANKEFKSPQVLYSISFSTLQLKKS